MKEKYITLRVARTFRRLGTKEEIINFFDKIKEVIKNEEKGEEYFSIILVDFYKKYINYEQVKKLVKKLNEIELLLKKYHYFEDLENLFKKFEDFSEIVEMRESGKYFIDESKEIAICLLAEEKYYPRLNEERRKFYDTLLPEADPVWLVEEEDNLNLPEEGTVKKTVYFDEHYHIRTYKNGLEDGIRIIYFWKENLKAEEYFINGEFQARVNVYFSGGEKEIYYLRKNKEGIYEKYGKYIFFHPDGTIAEGHYSNNEKTGEVTFYNLDGTYRKGYEEKGYLIMETSTLYNAFGNAIKEIKKDKIESMQGCK